MSTKYRQLLASLLPRGRAWQGPVTFDLCEGLGVEFSRLDARGQELLTELDPRKTFELLEDWERLLGLPDECQPTAGTIAERIAAVVRKLTLRGGNTLSKAFYIELAASIGYVVTIEEPRVDGFRLGTGRMGDRLYGVLWDFLFQVITDAFVTEVFRMGVNRMGDRLRTFQNSALECVINREKPAHMRVLFIYGS